MCSTSSKPHSSAFTVWNNVEGVFRDNEMQRAVYYEAEFHTLQQGDLTMTEYTSHLKQLGDNLRNVSHPVYETSQVLNLLRGLHTKYRYVKPVINAKFLLHTFMPAQSFLLLEEQQMKHENQMEVGHALYAGHNGFGQGSSGHSGSGDGRSKPRSSNKNKKRGKCGTNSGN